MSLIALCLLLLIFYNFLFELFGGLRMFRLVSTLQFCHSLLFASLGVGLVLFWRVRPSAWCWPMAARCALCLLGAGFWLPGTWGALPADNAQLKRRDLWGKLLPFAASVWVTNWLANLFEVVDRYMLVHFSGLGASQALGQVGAYHAARVLPLPMIAVAALLRAAVLPHLSHDWEAGRREEVSRRLNLTLKLVSLALFAGSVAIVCAAPWVFEYAFAGKFPGGLAVLPLTLVYLSWSALSMLASIYLWCAERAALGSVALALGLLANIGLNLLLVPSHGLFGAVLATSVANLLALTLVLGFSRRLGMRLHAGTWILPAVTASVALGPAVASAALLAILHQAITRQWLFGEGEKRLFWELASKVNPLPALRRRRATAA